jgi:HAD superfamily hydrolase (TIGR01509 family)
LPALTCSVLFWQVGILEAMAAPSPIKAVIFDCFGVLTTEAWSAFKQKYFKNDPVRLRQAVDLRKRVDKGLYSYNDFIRDIAELADISQKAAQQHLMNNQPNEELLAYIRQHLKPNYKIGMLSNMGGNGLSEIFAAEQLAVFDAVALSYELGVTKPEPRAYEAIASLLEVEPHESVMVDDLVRHCAGAREAGMHAVLYQDFKQFKTDLRTLFQKSISDF